MSPVRDQQTGGASYTFTRIAAGRTWRRYNLVFDKRLLLRTDNLSYAGDEFGASDPNTKRRRAADIAGWKANAGSTSNETIIKNGLSLLDNLVQVNAGRERDAVLALLRSHNVTTINGRPIEEIVK